MLKFIAFGDLEANQKAVRKILDLDLASYNCAIFTGDIPNPEIFKKLSKQMVEAGLGELGNKPNIARETEPEWALKQIESEFRTIEPLFARMKEKVKLIGVWGNADNTKILDKVPIGQSIIIVHSRAYQVRDTYILGYNGRPLYIFEKENKEQWAFTEEEIYSNLEREFKKLKGRKVILVSHDPPYGILDQVVQEYRQYAVGTYGKRAKDGHIGSAGLRKIVDKYRPMLHVFGHIHEGKGVFVGQTTFVNTGGVGRDEEVAEISIMPEGISVIFRKV